MKGNDIAYKEEGGVPLGPIAEGSAAVVDEQSSAEIPGSGQLQPGPGERPGNPHGAGDVRASDVAPSVVDRNVFVNGDRLVDEGLAGIEADHDRLVDPNGAGTRARAVKGCVPGNRDAEEGRSLADGRVSAQGHPAAQGEEAAGFEGAAEGGDDGSGGGRPQRFDRIRGGGVRGRGENEGRQRGEEGVFHKGIIAPKGLSFVGSFGRPEGVTLGVLAALIVG